MTISQIKIRTQQDSSEKTEELKLRTKNNIYMQVK